jgi:hypothetical protein
VAEVLAAGGSACEQVLPLLLHLSYVAAAAAAAGIVPAAGVAIAAI